ncbi:hypothetical protein BRD16_00650 [Halobacteriales archaeon SW_6_65_46]|nr:MAG: hypothetical protein BRD16_00650 [Halobacteriales archaeon SW_6_65_46]
MSDDSLNLKRRGVLGGITALAVGGVGLGALSSTASAAESELSVSASNVAGSFDKGTISNLTIDPVIKLNWTGFDDAAGKIFILIEAKLASDEKFKPIYRATPYLDTDSMGTNGSYNGSGAPLSTILEEKIEGDGTLTLADEDGAPNYDDLDFSNIGGVDKTTFLSGTSVGSADEYTSSDVLGDEVLQNNFADADAGYYGAAAGTEPFNEDTGGETTETTVKIRYTVEFQRPNLSQLEYYNTLDEYDFGFTAEDDDETKREKAAEAISGIEESDIDIATDDNKQGNSRIIMAEDDEDVTIFDTPSGLSYTEMRDNSSSHPGLISETTDFTVSVKNIEGSSESGVESNTNVE